MTFDLRTIMANHDRQWQCYASLFYVIFAVGCIRKANAAVPQAIVVRGESGEWSRVEDSVLVLTATEDVSVRAYGMGLSAMTTLRFTADPASRGQSCEHLDTTQTFRATSADPNGTSVLYNVNIDSGDITGEVWYLCMYDDSSGDWVHQGDSSGLAVKVEPKPVKTTLLPLWLQIIIICILLCLSGLFSGLNLGLMSLDKNELRIVESCGSPSEKKYAKAISPLRKRGNFLLCTILLGNVLVNNTLTILMDDLSGSGWIAIVGATMGIVVFGEIIPQAVCSRHGLAIGARTIWITKFFMLVTFPLSFPISLVLDYFLGEEIGNTYNRDRLRELLKLTHEDIDLVKDEVNIITGALELSKKTVRDIMTKLDDVYMIEYNSYLNFDTMNEIMKTGYTRIPVYEKERTNIVALLNIKDLAFVDPDDNIPLTTVCKFYNHPINYVFEDTKLDIMLEEFKKGKSHMSFVQIVNSEGEGDPFYETLGVVTLEDVIEEIIQSEIIDETDTVSDNRRKTVRQDRQQRDFSVFNQPEDVNYPRISPQLSLAAFQYLSTTVAPFNRELISEHVLQRLIKQPMVLIDFHIKDQSSTDNMIYAQGKQADYFVLILHGQVQIEIGQEGMVFDGGPFMYFGTQALTLERSMSLPVHQSMTSLSAGTEAILAKPMPVYTPDFSVKAITDVRYLKILRTYYIAAYRASILERSAAPHEMDKHEDAFTKEWIRATSDHPDMRNNAEFCNAVIESVTKDSPTKTSPGSPTKGGSLKGTPPPTKKTASPVSGKKLSPPVDKNDNRRLRADSAKSDDSATDVESPLVTNCDDSASVGKA